MLARRVAAFGLRGNPRCVLRSCSSAPFVADKKPFEHLVDKDGEQVPLDLEGPDAPHWNDHNEEFWQKANEFVADHPEVPIPYRGMAIALGVAVGSFAINKLFLEPGSAGRWWCDSWINSDKKLMFELDPDSFLSAEDYAKIERRREIARTIPLLTRLAEYFFKHPFAAEVVNNRELRGFSRYVMGGIEEKMRHQTPQQFADNNLIMGYSLIDKLEAERSGIKADEVDHTGRGA